MAIGPGEGFVRGFESGRRIREARERAEQEKEDRDLARQKLKFEMDRLKILDKESARRAVIEEAEFMSKMPGAPGPGGEEQPHAPLEIPEGGFGQPARTITPPTSGQTLQAQIAGKIKEARALRHRTVDGGVAERLGVPPGEYDSDILGAMTKRSESDSDNAASMAREQAGNRTQLQTTAMNNRTQIEVAKLNAAGRGGGTGSGPDGSFTDQDAANYATMLSSGEARLSQVPTKVRTAVINKMFGMNLAASTPALEKKVDEFTGAQAALDKIAGSLKRFTEASGVEKIGAGLQYKVDITALSRLIGRSLGEKGVFTNQDKEDFEQIVGIGTKIPIVGAAAGAYFAPELAADRIEQLKALMERVKERTFQNFAGRTGGRLPQGAVQAPPGMAGPRTAKELYDSFNTRPQ